MKERITVQSFVNEFIEKGIKNTQVKPNAISDFIREKLEIKQYLPFVEKRALCEKVLEASCERKNNMVEVDSVSRYLLFTISMLAKYTSLEFGNTDGLDSIEEYDLLCQSGLLNYILEAIASEYEACNNILNMMMADIDANNNNVAAVLGKALEKVLGSVDKITEVLADKVEEWNLDLSQIDIEKYKGLLDLLPQK
jgi:hypothetical protein